MTTSTEAIQKFDTAVAQVTRGSDRKEEMMMVVAPYANWGEFIVPAPLSIALLGELILISGGTDFSLEKKPPKDGFQVDFIHFDETLFITLDTSQLSIFLMAFLIIHPDASFS